MRGFARWRVALSALVMVAGLGLSPSAAVAQEQPPTSEQRAPTIIPKPNEGSAPDDAGDRGGALQLLVLGVVVAGVGGAALHLTRQARRARPPGATSP